MRKGPIYLVVAVAVVFALVGAFRAGAPPAISIESALPGIGPRTPVAVHVEEPGRGLSDVRVEFVQGDRVELLAERSFTPRPPWQFWGPRTEREQIDVEVGRQTLEGLVEGEAMVRVTAGRAASWLRHPSPAVREVALPVRLTPPSLQVLSTATYVKQGGSEAVVYRAGDTSVRDGVQVGDWFFPGHPLPDGGKNEKFALFAVPYDFPTADATRVRLVATDDVGNESQAPFVDRFTERTFRSDTIRVSDGFMNKVVPEILSRTPGLEDRGDLLENYLEINGELRKQNAAELKALAQGSKPEFLWDRTFDRMRGSPMAGFGDHRTYRYQGRDVDRQDHLGVDLAATKAVPVPAANDGVVVLADYFGIYGNAVAIDHGFGLMSLYGHLSSIDVEKGQTVRRGDPIGRTGDTGLAGGDHLHFTILLCGLPVDPVEWWDSHWIQDRIARKLGPGLRFRS